MEGIIFLALRKRYASAARSKGWAAGLFVSLLFADGQPLAD